MAGDSGVLGLRPRRLTDGSSTPEPERPGLKERWAALVTAAWATMRPTRNRVTGYIAIGAVAALIGTSLAVGVGASGSLPSLADIGAWLASSEKGEVAHANGLTGDVDGKVTLPPGMEGHPVSVSQDGKTILVLDEETGRVVRVDASQLTAEQSADYGTAGLQLVSGGAYAYVIDPEKGTVQRIDPAKTIAEGPAVKLDGKLGAAVVDPQGTLWVPVPGKGTVVPFVEGRRSTAVKVAKAGHDLVLTLADGRPVVTDRTAAVMRVLSVTGAQDSFNLDGGIDNSAPADILVPASTEGSLVPVLARDSGTLALVDIGNGHTTTARLGAGGRSFGAPQVLGKKVYIPDESAGKLLVYDTAASELADPVVVTKKAGKLELFVRNGLLWVNDQNNAAAAVINTSGKVRHIGKYRTDVPSARKPGDKPVDESVPTAAPASQGPPRTAAPAPAPSAPAAGGGQPKPSAPAPAPTTQKPSASPSPSPSKNCDVVWEAGCPEPAAPGTPQAQSGNGTITITFAAASGVTPTRYVLKGLADGQTVSPAQTGADGPFTFEVKGGSCDSQYSYTVVAEYPAGAPSKESAASAPVRPCIAPGTPQGLSVAVPQGGHGGTLTWQAPSGADASVKYTVSGPTGTQSTTATTYTYKNLQNSNTYAVSVTASNAAGSGGGTGSTLNLTPPDKAKNIVHNDNDNNPLYIRSGPSTSNGKQGTIPGNSSPSVTVHCKTTGQSVTHPFTNATSNVWGKITYRGVSGYVADIYLDSRYDNDVWDCT